MTLRRRSHCQQLAEFERDSIIELKRKGGFLSTILQNGLEGMYPLGRIFGSSGPGKALPQENYGSITYGSPLTEKTTVFTIWLGNVVHLQQK
ncbi:hypothetical protein TNCV_1303431 [Trichonephila clavipes]|nr:hypothetical protein TNCV_1303431 [Trichonephila clavipes]